MFSSNMKCTFARIATSVFLVCLLSACDKTPAAAQTGSQETERADRPAAQPPIMYWEEYSPVSTLVVPKNPVQKSRFPFIDVHAHQFRAPSLSSEQLKELVREMDGLNMAVMVNLSGGSGDHLVGSVQNMNGNYPGRFVQFANVDFTGMDEPGWSENAAAQLEKDVANGAVGLKVYKSLGMSVLDSDGERISVDDERIDPVWAMCGKLGIPVLIHTADPAAFWDEQDKYNERWFELKERPRRIRPADRFPPWEEIMNEQHNVFRKHSGTNFISAHLGWMGNDLDALGQIFDEMPNVYSETGAVIAELGRQPRKAKEWLTKYKDRILFGKDSWAPDEYRTYLRVFETEDEYFPYFRLRHAFWSLYGMGLEDDVLKHLYYKNALRLIPTLDSSQFPD